MQGAKDGPPTAGMKTWEHRVAFREMTSGRRGWGGDNSEFTFGLVSLKMIQGIWENLAS